MCSKHHDMWLLKIPGSSTGSLTIKNPGPELAEGPPAPLSSSSRMRGSILCSLFLWIPAYAGMTGSGIRQPSLTLPALISVFFRVRPWLKCLFFFFFSVANSFPHIPIKKPAWRVGPGWLKIFNKGFSIKLSLAQLQIPGMGESRRSHFKHLRQQQWSLARMGYQTSRR